MESSFAVLITQEVLQRRRPAMHNSVLLDVSVGSTTVHGAVRILRTPVRDIEDDHMQ
jgi:hypothetical protein